MSDLARLLTESEAAEQLGVSKKTLRGHVDDGKILPVNVGRGLKRQSRRYDPADIEAFKEARKKEAAIAREQKCQSTRTSAPSSTPTNFRSKVIAFTDLQKRPRSARR